MALVSTGISQTRYDRLDSYLPTKRLPLDNLPRYGLVAESSRNSRRRIHRFPGPPDDDREFIPVCPTGRRKTTLDDDLDWRLVHDSWTKIRIQRRLPFDSYHLCRCIECFRGIEVVYPGD